MIITVCLISNFDIVAAAKYWTKVRASVNCLVLTFHRALKRSWYFVAKRKNKRLVSVTIGISGV